MDKLPLTWLWRFALPVLVYAGTVPVDASGTTLAEADAQAQAAVGLATTAFEQASAWENLAGKDLDQANQTLAKNPNSAAAKRAAAAARKELNTATAYKAKTRAELLEKSARAKAASDNEEKNEPLSEAVAEAKNKTNSMAQAAIFPQDKYQAFADEYESLSRIDAYFFFNDPLDYKNKAVILDAKFDGLISPGVAKFTIWRNFGKMHLIVSNLPMGDTALDGQTLLLAGIITGFKKEVISGELILNTELKLKGIFFCGNARCPG